MREMKNSCLVLLLVLFANYLFGQEVPAKMDFAGMKLKITESGRREIQKDVDALVRSEKHFKAKLEKVEEYFPLIERVFREEGLPEDFKYLTIQESALVPDAVSTSNAVGFWQFKKVSAAEVGLRVDNKIDERMHIIAATRGAAKYLQKNNYFFNNWLHALQAYQMGPTGAMEVLGDKDNGARTMQVTKKTYWYVRKYLAHKIAFQDAIGKHETSPKTLVEYHRSAGKTLKQISKEVGVSEDLLYSYNKWIRGKRIPDDATQVVVVPMENLKKADLLAFSKDDTPNPTFEQVEARRYPVIERNNSMRPFLVEINGLKGILASKEDSQESLAEFGDLAVTKFRKYNDLNLLTSVDEDEVYYLEAKRGKAKIHYHTVKEGETLWQISQRYGIKLRSLIAKNRMGDNRELKDGRVLWLRKKRPASLPVEYRQNFKPAKIVAQVVQEDGEVDKEETTKVADEGLNEIKETSPEVEETTLVEDFQREFEDVKPIKSVTVSETNLDVSNEEVSDLAKPAEQVKFKTHVVKQGQTLFSIAKEYGVALEDILSWNDITREEGVKIDQELKIIAQDSIDNVDSENLSDTETYIYHEVTKGDTLFSIAKRYGVSVDNIIDWNSKKSADLRLGEKLTIKNNQ